MDFLQYKTRLKEKPTGKASVYFCTHPADFPLYFSSLSDKILSLHDCAIWYADPEQRRTPAFLENLRHMNLLVMPVTRQLLTTKNHALEAEFAFAMQNHIPVLPLMQESNLSGLFNQVCGNLQFLDPHVRDLTAISYQEKLQKYLDTVLLDDETIRKIQAAFDAYIFLSYRKVDRAFAQQLMRLIHQNDFCRDVAIWYDEFLTPGEDFNHSIQAALQKSNLFVMTVTPHITESSAENPDQDNYIIQKEYPMARDSHKPILPVEMCSTDKTRLSQKFQGIPPCTNADDQTALSAALSAALRNNALRRNRNSPNHDFFIGLAYLKGIDVEVDYQKALTLIQSAAEAGVLEAVEMMTDLYATGTAVEQSAEQTLYWQQRLVQLRQKCYEASPTLELALRYLEDLLALQQFCRSLGLEEEETTFAHQLMQATTAMRSRFTHPEIDRYLCAGSVHLAVVLSANGRYDQAQQLCRNSVQILQQALASEQIIVTPRDIRMPQTIRPLHMILLQDFCSDLCNLGDILCSKASATQDAALMAEADECFRRCCAYLESDAMRNNYPAHTEQLSAAYSRMGNMEQFKGNIPAARRWFEKALALDLERVEHLVENRDFPAFDAYARGLYAYGTADTQDPDVPALYSALRIWELLAEILPQFPEYKELYDDLKPYVDQLFVIYRDQRGLGTGEAIVQLRRQSPATRMIRMLELLKHQIKK